MGNVEKHVLTEEDLANNPDLAKDGLKVGDEIDVAAEEAPKEPEAPAKAPETPLMDLKRDELDAKAVELGYPEKVVKAAANKGVVVAMIEAGKYVEPEAPAAEAAPEVPAKKDKKKKDKTPRAEAVDEGVLIHRRVKHNGLVYEPGEKYELSEKLEAHFKEIGVLEPVPEYK